jgi:hypothetical protein
VARGELIELYVERALYEQPGNPHFLVRCAVANTTGKRLAVDLRERWGVPRPNQWGGLAEPYRSEINESSSILVPLDDARRAELRSDFRDGHLTLIEPGESLNFFNVFNASGRADIDTTEGPCLFVSIDGRIIATDGLRFDVLDAGPITSEPLILLTPVAWKTVPEGVLVVEDR